MKMNNRADSVHSEISANFRLYKHVEVFEQLGIKNTEQLVKTPFIALIGNPRFVAEVWDDYVDWFFSYRLSLRVHGEVELV